MLKLTLKKPAYEVMITGEKKEEYRTNSKWIMSRLDRTNKEKLKLVKFTNGYKKDSPSFITDYKGWEFKNNVNETYSNGLNVQGNNLICIKLGNERWRA